MARSVPRALPWIAASIFVAVPLVATFGEKKQRQLLGSPKEVVSAPYVGSGACRACHPGHTHSYENTFHSSMTRLPEDLAFDGRDSPALPLELSDERRIYRLERTPRGSITVRGPDLHFIGAALETVAEPSLGMLAKVSAAAPEVTRPLALLTGSHHYLAFWIGGGEGRELRQLPFVYLLDERTFVPRSSVFLAPLEETLKIPVWNSSCIQCHTTAGAPREREGSTPTPWVEYRSETIDLSISCEACHGPGERHAERLRNPLTRLAARNSEENDAEILDPKKLDAEASSALCGQCHAYFVPTHAEEWWTSGFRERRPPHEDFADGRELLDPKAPKRADALGLSRELSSIFWADGSVRVGGREYQGLLASACYERGVGTRKLSCVDCHQLHDGTRASALPRDVPPEASCGKCHDERYGQKAHTRHETASATCVDCHMPETSYALLGAVRSHTIAAPKASLSPPASCVPCHLDENEEWLEERLGASSSLSKAHDSELRRAPFGVRLALAGNAAERALVASWLGREKYRSGVDDATRRILLAELESDSYAAVREIARRSRGAEPRSASPLPETLLATRRLRDETPIVISE